VRVLIDRSFADRGPSGTQVYVDCLVVALRELGVEVHEASGRRGRHLNPNAEAQWQARLARVARRLDVLHHPLPARARTRTPQVVTVHDLAFVRVPECFNRRFRAAARRRHRIAARAAGAVVVPSEATAADARSRWGVDPVVAPHGPGQAPLSDRGEARHFLYVGDAEPRKNLPRLLAAYARYREQAAADPLPLVLAGRAEVRAPGVRREPRPDLAELHRHAAALVIPSLHEGFGLPALEAMHAGTPVLAARTAGLAEVCGDAARFCDPRDPESIAAALAELAATPPLREELRRRGVARAAHFSWRRSAEAHLRAYERAVGSGAQGP
jgi:glycosyltransferase involved in cell wall biosynthesis